MVLSVIPPQPHYEKKFSLKKYAIFLLKKQFYYIFHNYYIPENTVHGSFLQQPSGVPKQATKAVGSTSAALLYG